MDKEQINELIKNKNNKEKVGEFISNNLSDNQKNKLSEILSDKEKLSSLLNSQRAKELIDKLKKGQSYD
ncbi:MAG: hypothetical protein IJU39_06255 [Clostridia bacterium]|nr:hypothetical protein [Clostridia bacterium]